MYTLLFCREYIKLLLCDCSVWLVKEFNLTVRGLVKAVLQWKHLAVLLWLLHHRFACCICLSLSFQRQMNNIQRSISICWCNFFPYWPQIAHHLCGTWAAALCGSLNLTTWNNQSYMAADVAQRKTDREGGAETEACHTHFCNRGLKQVTPSLWPCTHTLHPKMEQY